MKNNIETEIKYFTEDELNKLFKAIANSQDKHKVRNEALFKIGYYCALRASEISLLKVSYFNTSKNELYCKRLKGSLNNTIRIIDSDIIKSLKRYLRNYNPKEYLFMSQMNKPISRKQLDVLMKHYCELAGIKDKSKHHFHTLKHTRAVRLAESNLDIKEIQYWLGHKEISNTQIYFQFTTSQYETLYRKLKKFEKE